jgi:hypothetical protein
LNQDKDVDLAPGQQLYIKILSSQSWDGAIDIRGCRDIGVRERCRNQPKKYKGRSP